MVTFTVILGFIGLLAFAVFILWTIKETWKDPGTGLKNKKEKE
jgi:hypothetical protein